MRQQISKFWCVLLLLVAIVGCSRGPARIEAPTFDPSGSAARAMDIYDKDGDGFVAVEELENAPGLNAAIKNLDTNKDDKVSEQEIAERVRAWQEQQIGLTMFNCDVTMDGQALEGATVTFEPEEFLGGAVQEAVDITSLVGSASPRIPKEKRPSPDSPPGMQAGLYKVRISKIVGGQETIPAQYNTETILGKEVASDDWALNNRQVSFNMKSK